MEGSTYKLVLIGDLGVGKTVLAGRFCEEDFLPNTVTTISPDCKIKSITRNGVQIKFQIWDTAGQERYAKSVPKAYCRGAHGVVIVFDITQEPTFTSVQDWVDRVCENAGIDTPMILVGNKSDLSEWRAVSAEDAQEMAKSLGMIGYIETSVKNNVNVTEVFDTLINTVLEKAPDLSPLERSEVTINPGNHNNTENRSCSC